MNTLGKVVDSVVIVSSVAVGYGAVKALVGSAKSKNTAGILLGGATILLAVYAFKEAVRKINE